MSETSEQAARHARQREGIDPSCQGHAVDGHTTTTAIVLTENDEMIELLRHLFLLERAVLLVARTEIDVVRDVSGTHIVDLALIDCSHGSEDDLALCARTASRVSLPLCIIHPHENAARRLAESSAAPIIWLPDDLPMRPIRDILRLFGGTDGGRTSRGAHLQLSQRERDTHQLAAQGCSDAQIAAPLGLAVGSVKTYRRRGREKIQQFAQATWSQDHRGAQSPQAARGG